MGEISKDIYINSSMSSNRIAVIENEQLVELYIDYPNHTKMVGNIYNGLVQNIIPGIEAAFIDINSKDVGTFSYFFIVFFCFLRYISLVYFSGFSSFLSNRAFCFQAVHDRCFCTPFSFGTNRFRLPPGGCHHICDKYGGIGLLEK